MSRPRRGGALRPRISLAVVGGLVVVLSGCRLPGATPRNVLAARAATERGARALDAGRIEVAERELAAAVEACEYETEARRLYAEALWQRGATREALVQIETAAQLSPTDPGLWVRAGQMRLDTGDQGLAAQRVARALELDSQSPEAWVLRGRILANQGQYDVALVDLLRALAHEPQHRQALKEVAAVYGALGRPEQSLGALQALADTYHPGDEPCDVYDELARISRLLQRPADAAAYLSEAAARTNSAERYCQASQAWLEAGDRAEAMEAARQAMSLAPSHPKAQALLAQLTSGNSGEKPALR